MIPHSGNQITCPLSKTEYIVIGVIGGQSIISLQSRQQNPYRALGIVAFIVFASVLCCIVCKKENAKLLSTRRSIALAKLYGMAWGKPWPHISKRSISEAEITDRGSEHDDADGPLSDILHVPTSFNYECFDKMEVLRDAFGKASVMNCGLVVRGEYGILLKALEGDDESDIVVTGQPGIGSYDT